MKKNAFTLIELIFVILIIGVLSAIAVPKFKNLKQNAEAGNVLKVGKDAFSAIPSTYVNIVDMEEDKNASDVVLSDLVSIDGRNWNTSGNANGNGQIISYDDNNDTAHTVMTLTLNATDRNVTLDIDCSKFIDTTTGAKCTKNNGGSTSSAVLNY